MARVLVADDQPAIRDVITQTCELDHYEVQSFETSAAAIAGYAAFDPDVMILDVNMPGGGAEAILAALEQQLGRLPCPAIVVSGFAEESLQHACIREVIEKPFSIDALRIALKTALGSGGLGSQI